MIDTKNSDGQLLPLFSEFYTIQGEGHHVGKPAYFIRLGGCDIGCHWCDTKASWNADFNSMVKVEEIANHAMENKANAVVVTGGEPSLYNLQPLCDVLHNNNIQTLIETAGTNPITGKWHWICLSPKKQKPPLYDWYRAANELKIIVFSEDDFAWAEKNTALVNKHCRLYLQPEWSNYKKLLPKIIEYVKNYPKWSISIQAHKFMNIP